MLPNIVWITIESARFDATSVGGGKNGPLQELIEQDDVRSFSSSHAHGIWTRASSASILTGTYPSHHRVGENISDVLPDEIPTVPELLKEVGYRTICLMNGAHVDETSGLDRGFDQMIQFSRDSLLSEVPFRTLAKYVLNLRTHGGGFTTNTTKHSTSYMMADVAKRHLAASEKADEPLFLYSHFNDPHHPYTPPKPYFDSVASRNGYTPSEAFAVALDHNQNFLEHSAHGCDIPTDDLQLLRELHRASVRYVESQIQELYEDIQSMDRDTIVVITGDHGELFGEDNMLAHRLSTHSAVSHVPLLVAGPTEVVEHEPERVQHIDVMSTLLAELGAETDSLQGIDLRDDSRDVSIVQRAGERAQKTIETLRKMNPDFDTSGVPSGDVTVFRTDEFKYETAPNHERLVAAPDGVTDISEEHLETIEWFRERGTEFFSGKGQAVSEERETTDLDTKTKKRLERLGYI
ncbi:hypothetical protein Z052_12535 [Halorubrum sp. C191]|uniref:sulfatase n=1 Tax=Halorubrum sp. C191 TaxID=1383842 RepID=UPI000C089AE3|nr:sulfatase [Halorubrum sp. C191]PHQ41874.1 hypothetical protein Z052_12535 [Halorubrum sp. C191]